MPLISNISSITKIEDDKYNEKSINKLKNKYRKLDQEIPKDIVDKNTELSDAGICFSIPNGVQIDKKENNEDENFKLNSNNSKFLLFNKNKPEITFKNENNDNNEENNNILSDSNIYEISNVILNSNIGVNDVEDNNLIIVGPKINKNFL